MNKIDQEACKTLRAEIDAALAAVMTKHGLIAQIGTIKFSDTDMRCQLTVGVKPTTSTSATSEPAFRPDWIQGARRHGYSYGLPNAVDRLGKKFKNVYGKEYVFLGINQTGHFAIGEVGGKMFKIRPEEMKLATW